MIRTYSGHSTAKASNELYRSNLAKGQTGLSIAFDLPTQTGYDPDHVLAQGEVGKVGVPVVHLGHMGELLDGIPLGEMNTSMTINAPAAWLFGLYVANAERQGVPSKELRGTTQNDIVKEYLSRGTYIFPPLPSRRLIVDMIAFCAEWVPLWNPMNVCSYHLQEAGATPVQELAYSLATAIGVLDAVRESGQVDDDRFPAVFASISFFVNSGIRFVEETAKMRAFTAAVGPHRPRALRRHRPEGAPLPLRRAGEQPRAHRGAAGEQRAAHRARDARRHAVARRAGPLDPAAGVERGPRPARARGTSSGRCACSRCSPTRPTCSSTPTCSRARWSWSASPTELADGAWAELEDVLALGGAFEAIEELKGRLVASHAERMRRIESGDLTVVGVNRFTEALPSPLEGEGSILKVDPAVEAETVAERGRVARRARRGSP